jgi:hypothetical protein
VKLRQMTSEARIRFRALSRRIEEGTPGLFVLVIYDLDSTTIKTSRRGDNCLPDFIVDSARQDFGPPIVLPPMALQFRIRVLLFGVTHAKISNEFPGRGNSKDFVDLGRIED